MSKTSYQIVRFDSDNILMYVETVNRKFKCKQHHKTVKQNKTNKPKAPNANQTTKKPSKNK